MRVESLEERKLADVYAGEFRVTGGFEIFGPREMRRQFVKSGQIENVLLGFRNAELDVRERSAGEMGLDVEN